NFYSLFGDSYGINLVDITKAVAQAYSLTPEVNVKNEHLVLMPVGASTAASRVALPHIHLTRRDGDSHRWMEAGRDAFTGVRAHYYDNSAEPLDPIIGTIDNIKTLLHVYADE